MKPLDELSARCCRYALTDGGDAPDMTWQRPNFRHLFCGEPTKDEKSPYCAAHHKLCYGGHGRDWRSTERMMKAVEQSVVYRRVRAPGTERRVEGAERHTTDYDGKFGVDTQIKRKLARRTRRR